MKKEEVSVLIVDDSEHIRALFSMALKKAGLQNVLLANDGEEGVELFQKNLPSIVFLDNMMPKLSGLDALEKIRQIKSDAVVVMISAVSSIEMVQEAKKRGASHYLMKPYMPSKVIELIQKLLNVEGLQP
jgi:DNA-binding NtrC family response regulator